MKTHAALCAAAGAGLLSAAGAARADDTRALQALLSQDIVTTASTQAESASSAPGTSVTLRADDLRVYGVRTLSEAVEFLALGLVSANNLKTPDLGARGVLLPGDNGKHFLLLIDGHAVNDALYGAARFDEGLGIPLEIVDRIEIVVGPGSVLYGSHAMLGVINVFTKSEKTYRGGHVYGEYELGRSARTGAGAGFHFDVFGERAEVTTAFEYFRRFGPNLNFDEQFVPEGVGGDPPIFRRGGPGDGVWGGTLREAYFSEAPTGTLRLRIGDFDVTAMASLYRRGIPYTSGIADVDFDDPESEELDRALRFDIKHLAMPSSRVQLTSRAYADGFDYQRRVNRDALQGCARSAIRTCQYYTAGRARWVGLEERLSVNWLESNELVTVLGVDARMRWVSAKEDALNFDTGEAFASSVGIVDDSAGIVSPYVQQTYHPNKWLDLNAGARLDIDERFTAILSPRGAVAFTPFDFTTLKAVYSQAFRSPTWDETDTSGYRQARGSGLDPEIVRSVESSIEQRIATQRLMFGVFRTSWENMIVPTLLTPSERSVLQSRGELPITAVDVTQHRNVATLTNFGYNASYDGTLLDGALAYGLNTTAAFARRDTGAGDQPLEGAPRFFGNARVSYAPGGFAPTPALAVSYVHERLVDRAYANWPTLHTAGPAAHFRATVTGRVPGLTGVSYRLSGSYNTAERGAYVAGKVPGVLYRPTEPVLIPVDRYTAFLTLRYDFASGQAERDE